MTISEAKEKLMELQRKMSAYEHALTSIHFDGVTIAPPGTSANRASSMSILAEDAYKITTADEAMEILEYLDENKEELDLATNRMVHLLMKDVRDLRNIPMDEYVEFKKLLIEAENSWHAAKEASDYEMFSPYLEKVFGTVKKFAGYTDPDKDPYDSCLNKYEEGLTKESCDEFFNKLREELVPMMSEIVETQDADDSFRKGDFPSYKQEEFAFYLMDLIGLDRNHVGLSTTEHPFTTTMGSHHDVRITTHYHKDDFLQSMYSVIHEGGHALYDTGPDDELAYTVLDGGLYMSIHESQSRFYENILARSHAFSEHVLPKIKEIFPQLEGLGVDEFYRGINKVSPSLIRIEADEVTYSFHVLIRYELEKRVMAGEISIRDLPGEWNRLYKEYLGVDVPDDKHGVLQDSHWADGMIGYFPSYALGSAYGAQFLAKMKETIDVDDCVRRGDYAPINAWNREKIWRHGGLYLPKEIIERATGESFSTDYYIDYLRNKYLGR